MKNDLTSAEWAALANFLEFVHPLLIVNNINPMTSPEENKKRAALAESGKEKFIKIAKSLNPIPSDGPEGHYIPGYYVSNIPDDERWAGELD